MGNCPRPPGLLDNWNVTLTPVGGDVQGDNIGVIFRIRVGAGFEESLDV